jgi:mannitol/fructose-specific phosphotransferase system IIA component (Ntr-type)
LNAIGGVLFALFYTLAGMRLDFSLVPPVAGLVILYFAARFIGKYISAFTAMSLAGMTNNVRNYLGFALLPHGGVAVGLFLLVQTEPAFGEFESLVTTVGLSALAINQLLGPSATRMALLRAGEDHKDRPQLLDFLGEHRISVDLQGSNREEVIRNLAGQLYATYSMEIEQEDFVQLVLAREKQETTCLGAGLMIPHAILDEGDEVKGVLGLSSNGLELGAPDSRKIHAVLLLATPAGERDRHLEILAAIASAITRDVNFSEQLYHARSPAHAYDVLHHEDQEDLNYFLEDAAERADLDQRPTESHP